jgi:hypothetical protein
MGRSCRRPAQENWCTRLARQFPDVQVEPDTIFVKEGSIYTSAGVTAGMDLATLPLGAPPEKTRIRYVPITRKTEGSEHTITIGSVASFSGHLIPGGMGGSPKIVLAPGAEPIHREYQQGRTTRQTYTDSGQKWDWSNTNYMYARFETDSDEYERFFAAMAQAMQKAKTEKKPN